MNKKILIGSIIAVAILILVSFTGVVGYQTTKSSTIARASPLFTVRSSRAIDEESVDLSCDYVGKGELNNIYLPERNDKTDSVDNLIYAIQRMDDKSLQRFAYLINYRLHQTNELQRYDSEDIFQSLKQLRDNPDSVMLYTEKEKVYTLVLTCGCPSIGTHTPFYCLLFYLVIYTFIIHNIIAEYLTINPFVCHEPYTINPLICTTKPFCPS